jgi:phage/plasmid-like protein (TIGR03299 family)
MAHELEIINGDASFFSVKEKAWHNLGVVVEAAQTAEQAIKLAKLDYEVALAPAYGKVGDDLLLCEKNFVSYRTDTNIPFGIVGSRYTVVQNWEAFEFFDSFINKGDAIFETAGVLGVGETVFITAKLPNPIVVTGEDIVDKYLLLTMSHDGTASITATFTPVRVVCNNTLQMALRGAKNKVSIRHTQSAQDKIRAASKLLGIINTNTIKTAEAYRAMAKTPCSEKQMGRLVASLFYSDKEVFDLQERKMRPLEALGTVKYGKAKEIMQYYSEGAGQAPIIGTMWGAYNAITGYYQNVAEYKDEEAKFHNIHTGLHAGVMSQAFDMCINPSEIESSISYAVNNYKLQNKNNVTI